ncbi:MAG: enoyl-CoA hydratase/isomerase family protein [Pseudomonadota bacterium]
MTSPDEPPVLAHTRGHIARVRLNCPARRNALGNQAIDALEQAFKSAAAHPDVRVVVLEATPSPVFCAGAALDELDNGSLTPARFHDMLDRVAACPLPTVAAISGDCHGGGAELPLACDFRLAVDTLRVRVPATRIGLCYPPRGIRRYTERLGPVGAKRILLAGETLTSDTLLSLGYLDRVADAAGLAETAQAFAEHLATLAPLATRASKALIDQAAQGTWDDTVAQAWDTRCARSQDLQRGLSAVRARSQPKFKGD